MPDVTLERALLYDFYGELLSEKQRDAFDLYYNDDLSLAEIAEEWGTSRQNVRDALKKAESAMSDFEEKTGLVRRHKEMRIEVEALQSKLTELSGKVPESAMPLLTEICRDVERLKDGI